MGSNPSTSTDPQSPAQPSRTSLPIRFGNPETQEERPILDITNDAIFNNVVDQNEQTLHDVSETLQRVDQVLADTENTLETSLLNNVIIWSDDSGEEKMDAEHLDNSNQGAKVQLTKNDSEIPTNSSRSLDTIGLEAALK